MDESVKHARMSLEESCDLIIDNLAVSYKESVGTYPDELRLMYMVVELILPTLADSIKRVRPPTCGVELTKI